MLLKEARFTSQSVIMLLVWAQKRDAADVALEGHSCCIYWSLLLAGNSIFAIKCSCQIQACCQRAVKKWYSLRSCPSYDRSIVSLNEDLMYFEWKTESVFHPFWVRKKQKLKQPSAFSPWMHFCRAAVHWQQSSLHKASHFQEGWWGYFFSFCFWKKK